MKNIIISIIIIALAIAFINYLANTGPQTQGLVDAPPTDNTLIERVQLDEFLSLSESKENVILDIRTKEEYLGGHLANSKNIDYYASDFKEELNKLDKQQTYLIYCRSGNRSSTALQIMKGLGFSKVYELEGGLNAWTTDNLPICVNC